MPYLGNNEQTLSSSNLFSVLLGYSLKQYDDSISLSYFFYFFYFLFFNSLSMKGKGYVLICMNNIEQLL